MIPPPTRPHSRNSKGFPFLFLFFYFISLWISEVLIWVKGIVWIFFGCESQHPPENVYFDLCTLVMCAKLSQCLAQTFCVVRWDSSKTASFVGNLWLQLVCELWAAERSEGYTWIFMFLCQVKFIYKVHLKNNTLSKCWTIKRQNNSIKTTKQINVKASENNKRKTQQ